jgi:hypothetical protein
MVRTAQFRTFAHRLAANAQRLRLKGEDLPSNAVAAIGTGDHKQEAPKPEGFGRTGAQRPTL